MLPLCWRTSPEHWPGSRRPQQLPEEGKDMKTHSSFPKSLMSQRSSSAQILTSLAGVPRHPCTTQAATSPASRLVLKLHSADGYVQGSQMCETSGPPVQAAVVWIKSWHCPRMLNKPSTSIPLMQLFVQKNLKNCL